METVLDITENRVKEYSYYRINIKSELAKELGLKDGDSIRVKIIEVIKAETSRKGVSDNA